jgi:NADH-quinone oxidoreductase subunit J
MGLFAAVADSFVKLRQFVADHWPQLLPVALGYCGIYLLLPRVRRSRPVLGALLAALALLLGGWYAVRLEVVLAERILFYAFAGSALVGGALLISRKNPVHAALSFALVVLSSCGLFLLQGAPFLMAASVIIYAGAIVVTFLFVIMLAQQAGSAEADQRSREPFLASLAGFVLLGALACVLHRNYDTQELDHLLAQVNRVVEAQSAEDVIAVMGDPAHSPPERPSHPLVDGLSKFLPGEDAVANFELAWQGIRQPNNLRSLQAHSRRILTVGHARRVGEGALTPPADLPLSRLSGTPANADVAPTPDGKLPERLPARNVAAVGTSLFTDYLLPVELAGVLLLVATIGAIAVAGRRAEELR